MRRGVFAQRDFVRLWLAQLVSALGGRITRTALPVIAVLSVDSSPLALGLLGVFSAAPGVVVALAAGGMIDRSRKRPILIGADLVRAVAVASLPIAAWAGVLTMPHIYAVAAVVGAAGALFHITDNAYLPALVGRGHLVQGNSVLEATESVAEVAGPGLAGVLIQIFTAPIAVAIDAASYLVSALFLGTIRKREEPAPPEPEKPTVWRDIAVGFRVSWRHDLVRPILLALAVTSFFGGFFAALYMLFALDDLGLDPATIGVVISMGGVGALLGAVGSPALTRRLGLGRALVVTLAISAAGGLCIPAASGPLWLVLVFLFSHQLIGDGFHTAFAVQAVSLRQTVLPLSVLARSNAAFAALNGAAMPLGALAAGALGELIGARATLWIGMGGGAIAPLFLLPLRRLERMPPPTADSAEPPAPRA
ncbi:MAG TPA: MFS transporter [Kofleriaceae bacterium]|nr:MFS transporter [Kofleriaceae bacterium]